MPLFAHGDFAVVSRRERRLFVLAIETDACEHVQAEDKETKDGDDARAIDRFFLLHIDVAKVVRYVRQRSPEHKEVSQSQRKCDHHGDAEHRERIEEQRNDDDAQNEVYRIPMDQSELNLHNGLARIGVALKDRDHRKNDVGDADSCHRHQQDEHRAQQTIKERFVLAGNQFHNEEDVERDVHQVHSDRLGDQRDSVRFHRYSITRILSESNFFIHDIFVCLTFVHDPFSRTRKHFAFYTSSTILKLLHIDTLFYLRYCIERNVITL